MELRHLRYFVSVAEASGVSRAALRVHISQPALSRQIHDLERELGVRLFVRVGRGIRLTVEGEDLLARARDVLTGAESLGARARALADGAVGVLRVGATPQVMQNILPGFLAAYRASGALDPLLAGALGALLTTWVTFAPCFLWIFLGAPWIEKLRGNRSLSGALSAITAAVVGVVANLGLWFGLHVLFAENADVSFGPLTVLVPDPKTFDLAAALIAAAAAVALMRFHVGMLTVLGVAAAAGLALRLL